MQIDAKLYDPEQHDRYRALCVKQPYADLLTKVTWQDAEGHYHASKEIEVRSRITNYRGDLLVCSSAKPVSLTHPTGVTCGFVELYGVKRVEDFTNEDWFLTCIPVDERPKTGWGWLMRNPRRVVEMPVKGQLGIYNLVVPKGDITIYPKELYFGKDGFRKLANKVKNGEQQ